MGTPPRNFEANNYYHIYARGNHRDQIFFTPDDYLHFKTKMNSYSELCQITIMAYCLMPNHYHLLVRQNTEISVTAMMRRLNISYAKHFNWQYGKVGHVYQGRYGSRLIIEQMDLMNLARYIHTNPRTFTNPTLYQWSDLSSHLNRAWPSRLLQVLDLSIEQYTEMVAAK